MIYFIESDSYHYRFVILGVDLSHQHSNDTLFNLSRVPWKTLYSTLSGTGIHSIYLYGSFSKKLVSKQTKQCWLLHQEHVNKAAKFQQSMQSSTVGWWNASSQRQLLWCSPWQVKVFDYTSPGTYLYQMGDHSVVSTGSFGTQCVSGQTHYYPKLGVFMV